MPSQGTYIICHLHKQTFSTLEADIFEKVCEYFRKHVCVYMSCPSPPPKWTYIYEKTCSALKVDIFEYVTCLKTFMNTLENACLYAYFVSVRMFCLSTLPRETYNKKKTCSVLGADIFEYAIYLNTCMNTLENACMYVYFVSVRLHKRPLVHTRKDLLRIEG